MAILVCWPAVVVAAVAMVDGRMSDGGVTVTREAYGDEWPFTMPSGILRCEEQQEITIQVGGTTYAVSGWTRHGGYADVSAIVAKDASGRPMDLGPLIDRGQRLCR